ncbi:SDR family NAD(P)-dependent oxidoreductase, partial [Cupriavidus sp. WS]
MTTSPFSLTNRVALITGGAQGLGLAIATALRQAGAHVIIAARNADRVHAAVARLDGGAEPLVLDITDEAAVAAAFARIDAS